MNVCRKAMRNFSLIVTSIFIATVFSCRNSSEDVLSKIADAESIVLTNPDSSLRILNTLDNPEQCPESIRNYCKLIEIRSKSRLKTLSAQDTSIIEVAKYYDKNSRHDFQAWAHVYASEVYRMQGNDSLALWHIRKAASVSEDNRIDNNMLNYFIYAYWGNLISFKMPLEAINNYCEAEKYARLENDTFRVVSTILATGNEYLKCREYDMARGYMNKALNMIKKTSDSNTKDRIPLVCERIATSYFMDDNYEKALIYIDMGLDEIARRKLNDDLSLNINKALALIKLNRPDSVLWYINRSKEIDKDPDYVRRALYELILSKYQELKKNYKEALTHEIAYASYLDSTYAELERKNVAEFQRKYDYQDVAKERDRLQIAMQRKDISMLWSAVVMMALVICALVYACIQRRKRSEVEISRERSINSAVTNIEGRMRQELMKRDRHVETLRNQILSMDSMLEKVTRLREVSVRERVTNALHYALTETEVEHLLDITDICYDGFISNLRKGYPTLTEQDLSLCALIKLGFQSRDIAYLLGVSDNTLKTRKKRLKKEKLGLGLSESLDEWIEGRR